MKYPRNHVNIVLGTDVGCLRANNEDSVGRNIQTGIAVLADGMGGHKAGEIASAMAVGTIIHELSSALIQLKPGQKDVGGKYRKESVLIQRAIEKANAAIHDTAIRNLAYEGMGTTVVVAAFYNDRISIGHVGDSRLYRLRDFTLAQLTTDHSLSNELIVKGYFKTTEEFIASGMKNAITRALGLDADIQVDLIEDKVHADDIYLLCSDGLTDMVVDTDIQNIIESHSGDLQQAVDQLIALAKKNGGRDNISVILACPYDSSTSYTGSWYRPLTQWFSNLFASGK